MPLTRLPAVFTLEDVQEAARIILHAEPDPTPSRHGAFSMMS